MQPAYFTFQDAGFESLETQAPEPPEIDQKINKSVQHLNEGIMAFKKKLYVQIVSNETGHPATSMKPMMTFHALFLQSIAYWIGLLDSSPVPKPIFTTKDMGTDFDALTKAIQIVSTSSSDSKVLLYTMISKYSTQHPFDLGNKIDSTE